MTSKAPIPRWVNDLFQVIDQKDTTAFLGYLSDDVTFRFGSTPMVVGKDAVGDAVAAFFDSIAALSHKVDKVWEDKTSTVCEGLVTYTRHDGGKVPIPFTDVFDRNGDSIEGYRIYIDISPLFDD